MAAQLLKEGKAYIDNTPVDKMREERMEGIESACRNNSVETNLKMWEEMVKGSPEGCKCCLRLKIDMKADNKTLRDPVGYRCNVENAHHRTGTKFKVRCGVVRWLCVGCVWVVRGGAAAWFVGCLACFVQWR